MAVTISFDSDGAFSRVADAFRAAAATAAEELAKTFDKSVAPTLVAGARNRASQWSSQTPPTIHALPAVGAGRVATVTIIAGGVAIAYLLEEGAPSKPGATWRHPVFGNRNIWVSQKTHPYMTPTAAEIAVVSESVASSLAESLAEALGGVDA